ncbi:MAG: hypothetical protein Q4G34_09480 [Micrococcus sp.]|nr:hypothetical protein [Micrococcus sp.]
MNPHETPVLPASPPPVLADWLRLGLGAAGVAVVLSPLRHYVKGPLHGSGAAKFTRDSFPLSTYPMFSEDRGRSTSVAHVIGITDAGERVIPLFKHFGPGGLNQVRKQVSRAVRRGDAARVAQAYADSLATLQTRQRTRPSTGTGAGATRRRREAQIVTVEVVRSRFRFDEYFDGQTLPQRETVLARADVGGTAHAVEENRDRAALEPTLLSRSASGLPTLDRTTSKGLPE